MDGGGWSSAWREEIWERTEAREGLLYMLACDNESCNDHYQIPLALDVFWKGASQGAETSKNKERCLHVELRSEPTRWMHFTEM